MRGVVLVRRRGGRRFVRLRRGQLLPDGSEIDTRRGTIRVTVASDQAGGLSTATVSEGRAIIDQNRAARPTTTLRLSEPLACAGRVATASLARAKRRKQREIFVRTKGGRFKTRGNHAAGTASGTAWRTSDTCSSTTIKVVEGTVRVRDLRRRRTVNVTAPDSYTARRRSAVAPGRTVQRASTTSSVERATKLLEGERLTVYIDSSATDSDVEHSVDLCPRGRAFVKSAFYWLAKIVRRGGGRWRVVSATTRRGFGRAKVRITGWSTPPTVRSLPAPVGRSRW